MCIREGYSYDQPERNACGRVSKDVKKQDIAISPSPIHISEPTRPDRISYAVFCLKKKNNTHLRAHETSLHLVCRRLCEQNQI